MAQSWLSRTIYFPLGLFLLCWIAILGYHNSELIRTQMAMAANIAEITLLDAGIWGPIYVFVLYFVSTIFFLPLWGFHVTCGYVYGTLPAAGLIICCQTLSAVTAFSIARYLFKSRIRQWFLSSPDWSDKFIRIDKGVSQNGLQIVGLLRLSPILPFGLNNYLCGCTDMNLWEFAVATFFCTLPGTTFYCWVGASGKQATETQNTLDIIFKVVAFVSTVLVMKKLSNIATKKLEDEGIK